jgi:putative phage-type endonuclease
MNPKIHECAQGSEQWHALRETHDTASEAPAMMGVSKYQTRTELLAKKATGISEVIDAQKQALFDRGHAAEASARALAEEIVGESLYPITATAEVEGLRLLASLDGATMVGNIIWEHKLWSESLAAAVRAGDLSPHYTVQMDQQLLVADAERCLFMVSDGTEERMAFCWYETTPEKKAAVVAGWKQFRADLADYKPSAAVAPAAVGRAPDTLPALRIEVTGQVAASNLPEFKATALAAIRSVNRDLKTDQDFADAERAVKWCADVESRLEAAKQHALSQTATIDELFKTMDDIGAEAKRVRLDLDKLVKARKESIKTDMVQDARIALAEYMATLNERCAPVRVPTAAVDFAAAIKGKRSIAAMQDAIDTELARAKIASSADADKIAANVRTIKAQTEHAALFPDVSALALKSAEDLAATITARIAQHAAEQERRLEAERTRIRAEEQAKAQREAAEEAARVEAQRLAYEADQRRKVLAEETAASARAIAEMAPAPAPAVAAPVAEPTPVQQAFKAAVQFVEQVEMARAHAEAEPATLKLGTVCERLGITMTAAFVADVLDIKPAGSDKRAVLFRESQYGAICRALAKHALACLVPAEAEA